MIDLFFQINPNTQIIRIIQKEYTRKINPNFHPMNDFILFSLRDIANLTKFYPKEDCIKLFSFLVKFNKKYIQDGKYYGTLPAIMYLCGKESNKSIHFSQTQLSSLFDITEVTIRNRIKYIGRLKIISKIKSFLEFGKKGILINEKG